MAVATHRSLAMKACPLCNFEAPSVKNVMSHLRTVHSSDPNFSVACGLNGCGVTSRSFPALYSHIYRKHPDIIQKRRPTSSFVETGDATMSMAQTCDSSILGWYLAIASCMGSS